MNNVWKDTRERLGYTQVQLSAFTGIPVRTIQNWEEGKRIPPKWVEKLVRFYIDHVLDIDKRLEIVYIKGEDYNEKKL